MTSKDTKIIDLTKDFKGSLFKPDRVLANIAITALSPDLPTSYQDCCYSRVSDGIRNGMLQDDDEIVLVGMRMEKYDISIHGLVLRNGAPIIDNASDEGHFDPEGDGGKGSYKYHTAQKWEMPIVARIKFSDFKEQFAPENVAQISNNAQYPTFKV